MEIKKAHAVKKEFLEDDNGNWYCPDCGSYDLDQFGLDGFECNECGLRLG